MLYIDYPGGRTDAIACHMSFAHITCNFYNNVKMLSPFRALRPKWRRWSPFPKALSQIPVFTLRDHGYGTSVSRSVPVYVPAFTDTHCAYPRIDGQAELTWVDGYILGWRWLTPLMQSTTYQLSQTIIMS